MYLVLLYDSRSDIILDQKKLKKARKEKDKKNLQRVLTKTRCSDGAPEPDGTIKVVSRKKILHYRQLYIDRPDPIDFMPVAVDTSGRIYDDFLRL